MSFNAGAITGGLQFDISEFAHGMLQAESISHAFPAIVVEFLENPLSAVVDVAREAGRSIYEAFLGTGELFDDMGREALKAGVSVKAFSTLVAAAKPDAIGVEQLGDAFKFMEERASAAMQGDSGAIKGFHELGISVGELSGLLKDPEALLYRLSDAFAAIPVHADRVHAAMDLLSRPGVNMLPFLQRGSEEIRRMAREMDVLGAGVDDNESQIGEKFSQLSGRISAAWTGVKKSVSEPLLGEVAAHFDDINGLLRQFSTWLDGHISSGMETLLNFANKTGKEIALWADGKGTLPAWLDLAWQNTKGIAHDAAEIGHALDKAVMLAEKLAKNMDKIGALADLGGIAKNSISLNGVHLGVSDAIQGVFDLGVLNAHAPATVPSSPRVQTGTVNITVNGKVDAKQVAAKLSESQAEQVRQATRELQRLQQDQNQRDFGGF